MRFCFLRSMPGQPIWGFAIARLRVVWFGSCGFLPAVFVHWPHKVLLLRHPDHPFGMYDRPLRVRRWPLPAKQALKAPRSGDKGEL